MAKDDETARSKAPGPRPVAALQEALGLQAGFARRRSVTGTVPAIRQAGQAPSGAPQASPVPSGAGQVGPTPDDSQTRDHLPMGDAEASGCHPTGGRTSDPAAVLATESFDRPSAARAPETDHGLDDAARFDELPSAPEMMAAARAAATGISLDDPDKPKGPDYDEMHGLAKALASEQVKARVKWRKANHGDFEEVDRNDEVDAEERLKVATPETQKAYLVRGEGMLKRFKRESGIRIEIEDIDPRQFVNWLLGLKPMLTINTWRNYRAAAAAVVQSIPSEHIEEALGMLYADLQVGKDEGRPGFNSKGKEKSGEIGASLPARRMEHKHYESLVRSLRLTSRGRAVEWLMDWLRAGINTGLRPNEWILTSIERRPDRRYPHSERIWLHVVTGKAAQGRGTHRTLDISNFQRGTLESVERMVARSREWVMAGRYSQRHGEVSRLFRETCQVLFPRMQKHYTLYSLRHQFISNMKTLYSREELAAMASHVSVDTQVVRDGKKRLSWTKGEIVEIPMPVEEQVKQVKKRIELLDERRRLRVLKDAYAGKRGLPLASGGDDSDDG